MKTIKVVAAVIKDGDKIFATQRGYGEFKDGWEFPGGKVEPGETPEAALAREIREELDTEIEVGRKIDCVEYDYPAFHLSMDCFWAEVISGNLILKEHEAAKCIWKIIHIIFLILDILNKLIYSNWKIREIWNSKKIFMIWLKLFPIIVKRQERYILIISKGQ